MRLCVPDTKAGTEQGPCMPVDVLRQRGLLFPNAGLDAYWLGTSKLVRSTDPAYVADPVRPRR
eukprot:3050666-Rhodomonas_salina.1